MSRNFQYKTIPSTWIEKQSHRLDCGPYMSGAIEARELLSRLPVRKDHLQDLTKGGLSGIVNAGRITRLWVDDDKHGFPFLSSTDILQADLSNISHIAKSVARQNSQLLIKEGWTLITRSGSIGRMAYARSDMDGMACSEDVLRVIPDKNIVKTGYLYAYLCSKFGLPIIISGTYGSIITHLEPHHIADLPVPRLGAVENTAHELVQRAANLRTEASETIREAIAILKRESGLKELSGTHNTGIGPSACAISSAKIMNRMDGVFHSRFHIEVLEKLNDTSVGTTTVGEKALSIEEPKRFKRIHVDDHEYGVPMFGTSALMWADPQPSFFIPKSMPGVDDLIVEQRTVLIPRSGQVSGIIGTAVLPFGKVLGGAVSEHAIRINCHNELDAGFMFVALKSEYGRRQLKARTYGSSIPSLDVIQVGQVLIPDLCEEIWNRIGQMGVHTSKLRGQAIELEDEARSLVERAIEEGKP